MELVTTHRLQCPTFSYDAEVAMNNLLSQCALTALERGDETLLDHVRSVLRCFEFHHLSPASIRKTVALCWSCLNNLENEQISMLSAQYQYTPYPLSVRHAYEEFYEAGTLYMVNVCNPYIGGFDINYCFTLYRLFMTIHSIGYILWNCNEDAGNGADAVSDTHSIATRYSQQLNLMDHELDENKDA